MLRVLLQRNLLEANESASVFAILKCRV